jgi:hypothetical protein
MQTLWTRARKALAFFFFLALAPFSPAHAQSAINGGVTQVQLDQAIANAIIGAGVTPSATGTGTLNLSTLTFSFPITGGTLSSGVIPGSTIRHDGSGIRFAAGTTNIEIGDFVIDTTSLLISGFARSANPASGGALNVGSGVPLFALSLGGSTNFPFRVALTATAASALNATFGVTLFTPGLVIGNAQTTPRVPEPATIGLLGLGLAGLYATRRRRLNVSPAAC